MIVNNKMLLVFLLIVFMLPMLASWILFHFHEKFHLKTTNYGILVDPPIKVSNYSKKWEIVYEHNNPCDVRCNEIKNNLLQIQKALGKDRERVSTLFMTKQSKKEQIYLVDPVGNLFIYYPVDTDPIHILKDMKHVLEVSQIG
jgi:hypothetical protein